MTCNKIADFANVTAKSDVIMSLRNYFLIQSGCAFTIVEILRTSET